MKRLIWALISIVLVSCGDSHVDNATAVVSLHSELGGDATGYERACAPRQFSFPQDHQAHPEFRNEWWYVTGNLSSRDAVKLGFHATFFRIATQPYEETISNSAWETSQFYMAHFAVTRQGDNQLYADERFARAAVGLAGAELKDGLADVWLEDWKFTQTVAGSRPQWHLQLDADNGAAIDLTLTARKPRVLQGVDGYSRKSADPCNASYYYAYTRLHAEGEISTANDAYSVSGSAWLDREWSSSALAENQVGWDWFALQFDDGREVMFYQLRETDGSASEFSSAVEINQKGERQVIPAPQLVIDRWWESDSGASYPVEGRLIRADSNEIIKFSPLIDNQELNLTVRYWEGAIELFNEAGTAIGHGYLELTGY